MRRHLAIAGKKPRRVSAWRLLLARAAYRLAGSHDCVHPLAAARFDGAWSLEMFDPPSGSATCGLCGSSMNIKLRLDVAEQLTGGGARASRGSDSTREFSVAVRSQSNGGQDARVIPLDRYLGTSSRCLRES